jgi:hypothetical protein
MAKKKNKKKETSSQLGKKKETAREKNDWSVDWLSI